MNYYKKNYAIFDFTDKKKSNIDYHAVQHYLDDVHLDHYCC